MKKNIMFFSEIAIVSLAIALFFASSAQAETHSLSDPSVVYTSDRSAVFSVQSDDTTDWVDLGIELGVESGQYTQNIDGGTYTIADDNKFYYLISSLEEVLQPSQKYYVRFVNSGVVSDEISFTTKDTGYVRIDSLEPNTGWYDDEVHIRGQGFGTLQSGGIVYFGTCSINRTDQGCATILSWDDNEIVVKPFNTDYGNYAVTGQVGIRKEKATAGSGIAERLIVAVEGPSFTFERPKNTSLDLKESQEKKEEIRQALDMPELSSDDENTIQTSDVYPATETNVEEEQSKDFTLAWWLGGGALGILLLALLFRKQLA